MTIYPISILPSTYPQNVTRYIGNEYITKCTKSSTYFTLNLSLVFMGLLVIGVYILSLTYSISKYNSQQDSYQPKRYPQLELNTNCVYV